MSDELTPDSPADVLRAAAEQNRKETAALLVSNMERGRDAEAAAAQALVRATLALLEAQRYSAAPDDLELLQKALAGASAVRAVVELPLAASGVRPSVTLTALDGFGGETDIAQVTMQRQRVN